MTGFPSPKKGNQLQKRTRATHMEVLTSAKENEGTGVPTPKQTSHLYGGISIHLRECIDVSAAMDVWVPTPQKDESHVEVCGLRGASAMCPPSSNSRSPWIGRSGDSARRTWPTAVSSGSWSPYPQNPLVASANSF